MLPLSHRDVPVVGAADSRSKLIGDRIQDTTIRHGNELYFVKTHMRLTFYPIATDLLTSPFCGFLFL